MPANRFDQPFVIGVTGNIACGKSTVVSMLAAKGAMAIDSDRVYHELIQPDQPLWHRLRESFGPAIISPDQTVDRRALGMIVFNAPEKLALLDALTHPAVIEQVQSLIEGAEQSVIAVDAVKLVESGMVRLCDALWLIECDPEIQLQRLMDRNALSRADAMKRIAAQPALDAKRLLADTVIENGGSIEETQSQVTAAWARLPILQS